MFLFKQLTRRRLVMALAFCLALAFAGPGEAVACEGGGEEPVAGKVEWVNFTNNVEVLIDHREDKFGEEPLAITKYGEDNNAEWQTGANKKSWPVVYVQHKIAKLEVRFALEGATRKFLKEKLEAGSNVPIVGELKLGTQTLKFEKTLTIEEVKKQLGEHETYLAAGVESNIALPEEVHLYEKAKIEWKWTLKSGGNTFKQSLGSSEHNLYIILAAPIAQEKVENFLTVIDLDVKGIEAKATKPLPTEAEAIEGIWSEFETKNIGIRWYEIPTGTIHRGGKALAYYEEIAAGKKLKEVESGGTMCDITATKALLEEGKGQCHSWAEIFSFALADQGVKSAILEIAAEFKEPVEKCETRGTCAFLVDNWEFEGAGMSLNLELPYKSGEIKDTAGIEGQGKIKNPLSVFGKHFLVEAKKGSGTLYDPSYGTAPVSGAEPLKKYQEKSIAGFCGEFNAMGEANCGKMQPATLQLSESISTKYE